MAYDPSVASCLPASVMLHDGYSAAQHLKRPGGSTNILGSPAIERRSPQCAQDFRFDMILQNVSPESFDLLHDVNVVVRQLRERCVVQRDGIRRHRL